MVLLQADSNSIAVGLEHLIQIFEDEIERVLEFGVLKIVSMQLNFCWDSIFSVRKQIDSQCPQRIIEPE